MACPMQYCYSSVISRKMGLVGNKNTIVVWCKLGQEETIMTYLVDAMRIIYQFLSINFLKVLNKITGLSFLPLQLNSCVTACCRTWGCSAAQ